MGDRGSDLGSATFLLWEVDMDELTATPVLADPCKTAAVWTRSLPE